MTTDLLIEEECYGGGDGGPFDPLNLPGLKGWWDFSDTSLLFTDAGITPVTTNGDPIAQANDKSGLGNNLTSPSPRQPIWNQTSPNLNNLGSAYFNGGTKYLLIPNIPHVFPLYIFIVIDKTPLFAGERFMLTCVATGDANHRELTFWATRNAVTFADAISYDDNHVTDPSKVISDANHVANIITFEVLADGTPTIRRAPSYSVSGVPGSVPVTSMLALGGTTGSGNLVRAYAGEMLICTGSIIPPADLAALDTFLNNKWAIY